MSSNEGDEILFDLLTKAEQGINRAARTNEDTLARAAKLFSTIEDRLNRTQAPNTTEMVNESRGALRKIESAASKIETQLASAKPAERLSRLNRLQVWGIALLALLALLSAFIGGVFATTINPVFSKAILPYVHGTVTCDAVGGWVQEATQTQPALCIIEFE